MIALQDVSQAQRRTVNIWYEMRGKGICKDSCDKGSHYRSKTSGWAEDRDGSASEWWADKRNTESYFEQKTNYQVKSKPRCKASLPSSCLHDVLFWPLVQQWLLFCVLTFLLHLRQTVTLERSMLHTHDPSVYHRAGQRTHVTLAMNEWMNEWPNKWTEWKGSLWTLWATETKPMMHTRKTHNNNSNPIQKITKGQHVYLTFNGFQF